MTRPVIMPCSRSCMAQASTSMFPVAMAWQARMRPWALLDWSASSTAMVTEPLRSMTLHVPQVPTRQELSIRTPTPCSFEDGRPRRQRRRLPGERKRHRGRRHRMGLGHRGLHGGLALLRLPDRRPRS